MWIETVVTKCTCELPECVLNIRNKRLNQIFLNPPLLKTPKLTLVPRRRWIIWRIQRTRQIRRIQDLNFFIQASTSDRAIYGLSRRERNEAQQMKYYHGSTAKNNDNTYNKEKENSDFKVFRRQDRKQATWYIFSGTKNPQYKCRFLMTSDKNESEERKKIYIR